MVKCAFCGLLHLVETLPVTSFKHFSESRPGYLSQDKQASALLCKCYAV